MLVYGVMPDKTCQWVIGKEVFQLNTLPIGEKDLARKIAAYRRLIRKAVEEAGTAAGPQDPAPKELDQLRHELYTLLFPAPVGAALSPGNVLYIIPTGPLYYLPFEALPTQAPGQPPRYLVEDYAVAYLSSASLLKTLREAQSRKQNQPPYPLLAFANPRYETGSGTPSGDKSLRGLQTRAYREIIGCKFEELPETEDEVRAIKELLKAPAQSNPLLVKEAASRSAIFSLNQDARLSAYRYLVFACHGILPGEVDRVVQPALVLSYPEKDGYLTMGDVFSLKLNAQLVSLSACNTGRGVRGQGRRGGGPDPGLYVRRDPGGGGHPVVRRVGIRQGAKCGHVPLPEPEPRPGRGPAGDQAGPAAGRACGNQYRDPFFWAPLVVFGDGR